MDNRMVPCLKNSVSWVGPYKCVMISMGEKI